MDELVMEQKVFYRNPINNMFKWFGRAAFILFLINVVYSKGEFSTGSKMMLVFSILYTGQHLLQKTWVIKMDTKNIYTRNLFLTRINKIPYTDILSYRMLVTGDIELKLQDKEIEISKDEISEVDFQEIKDRIIQVTQ